jgi:hypothetical protein
MRTHGHWFLVLAIALGACEKGSSRGPAPDGGGMPPPGWRAAVGSAGLFAETFDDRRSRRSARRICTP